MKNVRILIFTMLYFLKNKEKHLEISSFYIFVSKILMIWSTVFEIWVWLTEIGNYGHFLTFNPFMFLKNPKNQNFEKMKENASDVIILHKCTRNHNHMRYGSWDMGWDRQNFLHFGTFFALLPPNNLLENC